MPRGASPPPEMLSQLGQLGLGPGAAPPGLLQMAMGGGGADLSGIGRGGFQSSPDMLNGAPFRPITSPEDQNWSDPQGRPSHVGGPAPAYQPGTTFGGYNAVFDPRHPSSSGGFFTLDDYFKDNPENTKGTSGRRNAPSTNNWRLLPPGFQDPNFFMYNGGIISRSEAGRQLTPKSVLGIEGTGEPGYSNVGGPQWARTFGSQGAYGLNIGQLAPWSITSTPTY
jgi:hypothetical protein